MAAPIPDAVKYLWEKLHQLEPSTQLGGIFASKPGYHNTRDGNDPHNYSVVDPPDKGGPANLAAALDWTFPDAQSGRYDLIIKYSKRLLDSGKDPNDSRLDWMREFYGQADKDTAVEGWDFRYAVPASSDSSHLWHIHFSFSRNALTTANMDKLLQVLTGDDMDLTAANLTAIATAVWKRDIIPAPAPPVQNPDYGDPVDPNAGNKTWGAQNSLHEAVQKSRENAAALVSVTAKVDQILAILNAGIPVPGEVNLTSESVTAVAEAVADENAERQKE